MKYIRTSYVCVLLSIGLACSTVAFAGQGPGTRDSTANSTEPVSANNNSTGAQYRHNTKAVTQQQLHPVQQLAHQQRQPQSLPQAYVQSGCEYASVQPVTSMGSGSQQQTA
jgi:hypothetical protein